MSCEVPVCYYEADWESVRTVAVRKDVVTMRKTVRRAADGTEWNRRTAMQS